jgi:hypothetical protein
MTLQLAYTCLKSTAVVLLVIMCEHLGRADAAAAFDHARVRRSASQQVNAAGPTEAVLRFQIARYVRTNKKIKVIFLTQSPGGMDRQSTSRLIERLKDLRIPIKPVDAARLGFSVAERNTGRRGIILTVDRAAWISNIVAEVRGSYFLSGRAANRAVYSVRRYKGRWFVVRERVLVTA